MEVASQVVVLNKGQIEQQGSPADIYDHPANVFVSKFIGHTNEFELSHLSQDLLKQMNLNVTDQITNDSVVHIRPHDIEIKKAETDNTHITLRDWQHLGALIRIELTKNLPQGTSKTVYAEMTSEQFKQLHLKRGDKVDLRIRHAQWFH